MIHTGTLLTEEAKSCLCKSILVLVYSVLY